MTRIKCQLSVRLPAVSSHHVLIIINQESNKNDTNGVAGTLIFVHIANFATLQPWLHVGSFTCRIFIHCICIKDPYFHVPLRDTTQSYDAKSDTLK